MNIIDGRQLARKIHETLAQQLTGKKRMPGLAVILIGGDEGSKTYVKLKKVAAEKLGIQFSLYRFPETVEQAKVEEAIDWLNTDDEIDGIIIQLPLPKHLDENALVNRIDPKKDADGFHAKNIARYLSGDAGAKAPGLIDGIMRLMREPKADLQGKRAIILANSHIFADPMKKALERHRITADILLKPTSKNAKLLRQSDILIVAIGKKHFINARDLKKDAIIIDVGYNRINNRVYGDVNPNNMKKTDIWMTPVPGGVGPVTVMMLLERTVQLFFDHHE